MKASISCCEHDNKENIPPSSVVEPNPVLQESKLSSIGIKVKRRFRRPLRDITNLFIVGQSAQSGSAAFSDCGLHSLSSSAALICRKRKAADDDIDLKQNTCSKILRKEFR